MLTILITILLILVNQYSVNNYTIIMTIRYLFIKFIGTHTAEIHDAI